MRWRWSVLVYLSARVHQGPSPDEVALVDGARLLGFEFRGRTRTEVTVSLLGHEVRHGLALRASVCLGGR
jgi:hypothetical protein